MKVPAWLAAAVGSAAAACVGAPAATAPAAVADAAASGPASVDTALAPELALDAKIAAADAQQAAETQGLPPVADAADAGPADSAATDVASGDSDAASLADVVASDSAADAQADAAGDQNDAAEVAGTADAAPGPVVLAKPVTQPLWLTNGAFAKNAAYPSAVVFAPAGFAPTGALQVIVYLHGHYNCATNVLGDTDSACKPGGSKRPASKLASQLTATGVKALLVVPEVKLDEGNSDPGTFAKAGGFKAFLAEALAALQPPLLPRKVEDVQVLAVGSHSGGYLAAAAMATVGGLKVDEVWLLDSLYGAYPSFVAWAKQDLAGFGKTGPDWQRRLFVVYSDGGGTVTLSKQLATEAKGWVPAPAWLHDQTTATWGDQDYEHGLLFKHSGLSHHGVTTYYFGKLVGSAAGP